MHKKMTEIPLIK